MVSCQLLVGAKHLQDKLSVIAKNSSPNASPVQLSVVSSEKLPITYYLFSTLSDAIAYQICRKVF
ncbi:hypothetical protein VB638_15645 [Dolichospermum sp. UHCC 0684]|uniref:hypothetical protein n=1 Tax=Dolichospermum sp. UHCC 0299 TaxID=2590014 RepID=UPI000A0629A0|nr:hypothetical protein [Dolichospermum sp. UHCC 0299]MEA5530984.1 hypothetical protein [Dolichospermum sp. UHCC 0684]MTJ22817.1 hypothetical protein [Dolichospermum sp. UHCC 0352]MTJ35456.1 hypothetical protein [Dolichospermum sp. UHCC 0260]MTJ39913.1 hypothetical protein [Dolichospermum sp. UHCC 0406]MTJ17220.1 hypothetical protein [Dolichospermum sp. UHCC 0299]